MLLAAPSSMATVLPTAFGSTETEALVRDDFVCRVPFASTHDLEEEESVVSRLNGLALKRGP